MKTCLIVDPEGEMNNEFSNAFAVCCLSFVRLWTLYTMSFIHEYFKNGFIDYEALGYDTLGMTMGVVARPCTDHHLVVHREHCSIPASSTGYTKINLHFPTLAIQDTNRDDALTLGQYTFDCDGLLDFTKEPNDQRKGRMDEELAECLHVLPTVNMTCFGGAEIQHLPCRTLELDILSYNIEMKSDNGAVCLMFST